MSEVYMLQPVTSSCELFCAGRRRSYFTEPDLDDLMNDPMTLAVMAADQVDACELHALFADVRQSLR